MGTLLFVVSPLDEIWGPLPAIVATVLVVAAVVLVRRRSAAR